MNDQLITKETAVLAKEKGFNLKSDKGYYKHGSEKDFTVLLLWEDSEPNEPEFGHAPTQSLLQRWLREIHNISIEVFSLSYHNKIQFTMNIKKLNKSEIKILSKNNYHFETYEEALEFGLQKALELL